MSEDALQLDDVVVIGGGIIGLSSAYYLNKAGHHVTVVDQSNLDAGASYVNAGYLSPSHLIPLSAPGVMKKGLKWMFNPASPLYIKPRFDLDFLRWSWAFNKSCNLKHVQKAAPVIRDISLLSQELMTDIKKDPSFTFHYQKKGLFMLCQTEKMLEEELEVAKYAVELGLAAKEVSRLEIQQMEPDVNINAIGAAYFECDHHSTPQEFMTELKAYLTNAGVNIYANEKVLDIVLKGTSQVTLTAGKHWIAAKQPGVLLNIVTTYAWTGSGYVVPSAAAKAGVLALTRSLAVEWAKYGIRSNAIAPGPFPTEGAWSRLLPGDLVKKFDPAKKVPVGRVGVHQELANLAAYLISDFSAYVNGDVITIDGGEWLKGAGEFNNLEMIPQEMWDMMEASRGKKP